MTDLVEFLFPAPARRTTGSIIRWWEARRPVYNLIMGGAGLLSSAAFTVITSLPPQPHPDGFPPLPVIVVFGLAANVCYTLGPMVELALEGVLGRRLLPVGPTLFRMGLTFSVGLALLPVLVAGFDLGFRVLRTIL
ncbi:MAG TPA: hypothetical protein VMM83_03190 [Longimicrobiales bacterium]|nr:hypothetical protein [Longimicrobiales bacterium]